MNEAEKSGIVQLDFESSEEGDVLPGEARLLEEDKGLTEYEWALCDGEGGCALPVGHLGDNLLIRTDRKKPPANQRGAFFAANSNAEEPVHGEFRIKRQSASETSHYNVTATKNYKVRHGWVGPKQKCGSERSALGAVNDEAQGDLRPHPAPVYIEPVHFYIAWISQVN